MQCAQVGSTVEVFLWLEACGTAGVHMEKVGLDRIHYHALLEGVLGAGDNHGRSRLLLLWSPHSSVLLVYRGSGKSRGASTDETDIPIAVHTPVKCSHRGHVTSHDSTPSRHALHCSCRFAWLFCNSMVLVEQDSIKVP